MKIFRKLELSFVAALNNPEQDDATKACDIADALSIACGETGRSFETRQELMVNLALFIIKEQLTPESMDLVIKESHQTWRQRHESV